jgi:DNA-binding response OmpR family regulator
MKKKVLLVDDKKELRMLIKLFLSSNYDVETAEDGLHALSLIQGGFFPDVIVSDLNMPGVDGKMLVKQIKSSGLYASIPVIILSNNDKSSERVELMKAGAGDYLTKPFNPEELQVRIEKALRTSA